MLNKLSIIGHVVETPALKVVKGNIHVTDFRIAVNDSRDRTKVTYFKATAWRGLADMIAKQVVKGQKLYLSGPVSSEAYISKVDGQPKAQITLTVQDFEFAGPTPNGRQAVSPSAPQMYSMPSYDAVSEPTPFDEPAPITEYEEVEDDGLPF